MSKSRTGKRICSIDGCGERVEAWGWCPKHYARWRRHGDPLITNGRGLPVLDRVFLQVEFGDCWEWLGRLSPSGYGVTSERRDGKTAGVFTHRVVYEHLVGPIPDGLQIDHLCRNTRCCNPEHLEPVTAHENVRRSFGLAHFNALKTHCPQGHEYSPENTYVRRRPDGTPSERCCRTCLARRSTRRRQRVGRPSKAGRKAPCPHCNEVMHPDSITVHTRRRHVEESHG